MEDDIENPPGLSADKFGPEKSKLVRCQPFAQSIQDELGRDVIEQLEARKKGSPGERGLRRSKTDERAKSRRPKRRCKARTRDTSEIQFRNAITALFRNHSTTSYLPMAPQVEPGIDSTFGTPTRANVKLNRAPVTSLNQSASAGDTVLMIDDDRGFAVNDKILIVTELGTIVKF